MSRSKTDKNPQWRSTKIVATLGPSSNSLKIIKDLIRSGVNVFRLNMSHGSHDEHLGLASDIRKASKELGTLVAILVDLCGPKIRIGRLKHDQVFLKENNDVDICCKNVIGDSKLLPCQYRNLYKDVKKGHRIFIDDGKIELVVKSVKDKMVRCKIVNGGVLRNNKGINLPDTDVSISGITKKDRQDVEIAKKIEADFIALSFVKDKSDIKKLKKFLADNDCEIAVIAKIERREAVYNIDEIINESYGIMIARGDLGIELPAQEVPIIQKKIVASCQQAGKPAIVATQMLESMIYSSQPTRAEVGDVANAALSSVDAVMLSAETASGDYPVKAVTMMDSILREMESYQLKQKCFGEQKNAASEAGISTEREAFSYAVTSLAGNLDLKAIIIPTRSGTTATALSAERPLAPLIAVSTELKVCCRLLLHWGILSFNLDEKLTHDWKELSADIAKRCLTRKGKNILLVSGFNDDPEFNEPVLKLISV